MQVRASAFTPHAEYTVSPRDIAAYSRGRLCANSPQAAASILFVDGG